MRFIFTTQDFVMNNLLAAQVGLALGILYQNRYRQGDYEHLINELRLSDPDMFFNYTRMSVEQFDCLLSLVGPKIKKHSIRTPIHEGARLALTLGHLATGDSLQTLAFAYRIAKCTASVIVKETCSVIYETLAGVYLKPLSAEEWREAAENFNHKWDLPNCVGAIDGKHCVTQAPAHSGSAYYNYKKTFSIVLMAICDADCYFTYINVGAFGSQSDGGVFRNTEFGKLLIEERLNLPEAAPLPGTEEVKPHFFVADEAFPLRVNLMRPYGGKNLSEHQQVFNDRLSRARRCIENAFGILVARFRIFHRIINASPDTTDAIIKAAAVLHNYIKCKESTGSNIRYSDASWTNEIPRNPALQNLNTLGRRIGARNATAEAIAYRDCYKDYVNSDAGVVPWQLNIIRRDH